MLIACPAGHIFAIALNIDPMNNEDIWAVFSHMYICTDWRITERVFVCICFIIVYLRQDYNNTSPDFKWIVNSITWYKNLMFSPWVSPWFDRRSSALTFPVTARDGVHSPWRSCHQMKSSRGRPRCDRRWRPSGRPWWKQRFESVSWYTLLYFLHKIKCET